MGPAECGEGSGLYLEMKRQRERLKDAGRGGETESRRERRGPQHLEAWTQVAWGSSPTSSQPRPLSDTLTARV